MCSKIGERKEVYNRLPACVDKKWLVFGMMLLVLFVGVTYPLSPPLLVARVTEIVDGSTVRVSIGGRDEMVRLIGVGVLERQKTDQSVMLHGLEARQFIHDRLEGKTVYLERDVQERDENGCLLAYVWMERPDEASDQEIRSKMLNAQLLLCGCAQNLLGTPNVRYLESFRTYQAEAQKHGRGLWAWENPEDQNNQGVMVYVTETGKKYHREGCRYLAKSKIPVSLEEARKRGYEPCSVCRPLP